MLLTLLFAGGAGQGAVGEDQLGHPGAVVPALQPEGAVQQRTIQSLPGLLAHSFTGWNPTEHRRRKEKNVVWAFAGDLNFLIGFI